MTLHPWHLHAYTALCDLARSWPAARAAAGRITFQSYDGLRSTVYGRTSTGGISDGGMLTAIQRGGEEATHEREYWTTVLERIADHVVQALWLTREHARLDAGPLTALLATLPYVPPTYARDIAAHLADADRTARRALNLPPDHLDLPGATCPTCETRLLTAHTSSPHRAAWTVTCAAGCRTDGAPSIWRWTTVIARDGNGLTPHPTAEAA